MSQRINLIDLGIYLSNLGKNRTNPDRSAVRSTLVHILVQTNDSKSTMYNNYTSVNT
jgi:hypothetical protein